MRFFSECVCGFPCRKPLGFLKNQRSVLEEKTTPQEPKGLKKGNQKQTPAAEKTMSECMPRLLFTLKSSIAYKKGLQLSSTILKNNVRPYWEHVGTLYFRGKFRNGLCLMGTVLFFLVNRYNIRVGVGCSSRRSSGRRSVAPPDGRKRQYDIERQGV